MNEPTLPHADHVETVDVLGDRAREERERTLASEERAALVAQLDPRADGEALQIGRYQLLELIGAGGMGMVWGAWDPELERRVAVKLVRQTSSTIRERMLREGQVLARLSHPNVVPIFDVGVVGESVYLVMEWVRGVTLRAYAKTAPGWRAVLSAYRQAGEGLAAAHRAGVIHRDFKPDNAVRGDDGRVRVLDFGLALADQDGGDGVWSRAGTRRYMPPEQERGERATAASDQFAFCVSLREAMGSDGPGWIAPIVARGASSSSSARFPSMDPLLAALQRDPAQTWRRGAIAVVAIGCAAGAFAVGRSRARPSHAAPAVEVCSGGADAMAATWSPARRDAMSAHLADRPGIDAPTVARLGRDLDAYAAAWIGEHRRACLAHRRAELTDDRYDERLGCLARARAQLDAVGELMSTVDDKGLDGAVGAARSLADVGGCAEPTGPIAPPPAAVAAAVAAVEPRLERVRIFARAERMDALPLAQAVVADARATGYTPLIARARLVEAIAMSADRGQPEPVFADAVQLALAGADDVTAVEAFARWLYAATISDRPQPEGWTMMRAIAERLGPRGRWARALLYRSASLARRAAGDEAGAVELLQRAADILGDSASPELLGIQIDLAKFQPDLDDALRLLRLVVPKLQATLGPFNPKTQITRLNLSALAPDIAEARAPFEEEYARMIAVGRFGVAGSISYEAAWLADEAGDTADAVTWMKRANGARADERSERTAAYVAIYTDGPDRAQAIAALVRSAAAAKPAASWDFQALGDVYLLIAVDADRRGRAAAATVAWQHAAEAYDHVRPALYIRRASRVRAELAERWAAPRPDDARRYAAAALVWYRRVPAQAARTARLEAIAATP